MLIFYSADDAIQEALEELGIRGVRVTDSQERVLEWLEEVGESGNCFLFLDFDFEKKRTEKFNASLVKKDKLIRIIFAGDVKLKEFKKHQKGKTAANGYVRKPLTAKVISGVLNDFQLADFVFQNDLFDEGVEVPPLPAEGAGSASAKQFGSMGSLKPDDESGSFDITGAPVEMKVDTRVRNLIKEHSVGGGGRPYESSVNDEIQKRFDEIFGVVKKQEARNDEEELDIPLTGFDQAEEEAKGPSFDLSRESEERAVDGSDAPESLEGPEFEVGNDGDEIDLLLGEEESASDDVEIDLSAEEDIEEEELVLPGSSLETSTSKDGVEERELKQNSGENIKLPPVKDLEFPQDGINSVDLGSEKILENASQDGDSALSLTDEKQSEQLMSDEDDNDSLELGESDGLEEGSLELGESDGSEEGSLELGESDGSEEGSLELGESDGSEEDSLELGLGMGPAEAEELESSLGLDEEGELLDTDGEVAIDELSDTGEEEIGENTNPTMIMTKEMTEELLGDGEEESLREFKAQVPEIEGTANFTINEEDLKSSGSEILNEEDLTGFNLDGASKEEDSFDDEFLEEPGDGEDDLDFVGTEEEVDDVMTESLKKEEELIAITPQEGRVPPSFNEGEMLRLQATIRQLREEREKLLIKMKEEEAETKVLEQENLSLKAELDEANIEISILKKRHGDEIDEMKYRLRLSDEKRMVAEEKARKLQKEFDRLQQKVRMDFNQVKQREKDLESRLELAQMDSDAQVKTRDQKILELKRKIDQLEFNMENVTIKEQKSRDDKLRLEESLSKIMKTLRGSIELLEDDLDLDPEIKDRLERLK